MPTPSHTVADVVLDHSECAQVFQQHRIDFCCRGHLSIERAAEERGVELSALMAQLEQAIARRRGDAPPAMRERSTPALIEHIVDTHHAYLRKTLPFVRPLARKVARVHGDHNPKLLGLAEAVDELTEDLLAHLDDEEENLFPALNAATATPSAELTARITPMLAAMHDEHLGVATLLEKIRDASDDFTLPDWACGSYRALFGELQAIEDDVFRHVHLENHVLKPRFEQTDVVATPVLRFDLAADSALLAQSPSYRDHGHAAKTLVRTADSRVVLFALRAGARLQEHRTDHTILVQTLTGHVHLTLPTETVDLPADAMVYVDAGVPHDVIAQADSTVLLTINWHVSQVPDAS